jgi:hypothetical protein
MEKLHSKELLNLYSHKNSFRVMKARRMRWLGHETHVRRRRGAEKVLVGRTERKRPLRNVGIYGRLTLKWFLQKKKVGRGLS